MVHLSVKLPEFSEAESMALLNAAVIALLLVGTSVALGDGETTVTVGRVVELFSPVTRLVVCLRSPSPPQATERMHMNTTTNHDQSLE